MNVELPFPVSVEIKGVRRAATFIRLADALEAVRTGLARLPLDDDQAGCLADRFSEASAARIAHQLVEFGAVRAMAYVGVDSAHPILRVTGPAGTGGSRGRASRCGGASAPSSPDRSARSAPAARPPTPRCSAGGPPRVAPKPCSARCSSGSGE